MATSLQQLDTSAEKLADGLDEGQLPELARLRRVLALVHAYVENADAGLVGRNAQDQLANHLSQAAPQLQQQVALKDQGSPVDLSGVNELLDYALDDLGFWPPLPAPARVKSLDTAVNKVEADATAILQGLRARVDEVDTALTELRSESEQAVQARDVTLQNIDARVTELQTTIDQQATRLEAALTQQSGNFDTRRRRVGKSSTRR